MNGWFLKVNVGKYTIHGSCGYWFVGQTIPNKWNTAWTIILFRPPITANEEDVEIFSPKQSYTLDLPPSPIEWPPGILPCFTTESQPKTCKFTTALHPAWGVDPSTHHWSGPHLRCSQSRQLGDCHPGSGNGACFVRFVQHVFNDKSRNRQRNIPSSKLTWQWNTFINGLLNR